MQNKVSTWAIFFTINIEVYDKLKENFYPLKQTIYR